MFVVGKLDNEAFLRKYDTSGVEDWTRSFRPFGVAIGYTRDVTVDGSGNAYVAGGGLASLNNTDAYIRKFDPSGAHVWTLQFGDGTLAEVVGVANDTNGNVYWGGMNNQIEGRLLPFFGKYSSCGL